jgi:hypothetical protein
LEKKPEEHALEYAGFWLRFGAAVFDLFIVLLLLFVFYSLIIIHRLGDYCDCLFYRFLDMERPDTGEDDYRNKNHQD